ncbi:MAG: hypothetical protein ACYTXA_02385 [Nostoc sp.]
MPYTSLLRLRQRQRYFDSSLRDPSLRDAARSLLPRSGTASSGHRATRSLQLLRSTAKLRATRRSVQVSTSAPCPKTPFPCG